MKQNNSHLKSFDFSSPYQIEKETFRNKTMRTEQRWKVNLPVFLSNDECYYEWAKV